MSFRRMPFQFTTTDPAERQRELEKRFGLPSSRNTFVDDPSSGAMPKQSATFASPRLQHRVPIFAEGYDQPLNSSVDTMGAISENKKPKVRVIPIEIEGSDSRPASTRHRAFSGPAGIARDDHAPIQKDTPALKHPMVGVHEPSMTKDTTESRVHNIPIQVENSTNNLRTCNPEKLTKDPTDVNGCTVSKPKLKSPVKENKRKLDIMRGQNVDINKQEVAVENSLKGIVSVLEEFKAYEAQVHEFSGTTKDKKYRYLDEMLTRCMLKLDDVDTLGNDRVRSSRKNAVKKIQACIDLLESKTNSVNGVGNDSIPENVETSEIQDMVSVEKSADVEMGEDEGVEVELPESSADAQTSVVAALSQDASDECKVETEEEITSEVPEVEMEKANEVPSEDLNPNVDEVEMVESPSESNDNPISIEEDTTVKTADEPINATSHKHIEMKDVQRTLNEIKENTVDENVSSATSSHEEDLCEADVKIEKNIPLENAEVSLSGGDIVSVGDVGET